MQELHIIQVGDVLVSPDIITEKFCCDLDKCKGECCVEGDAGAPLTMDEIAGIEDALDIVWNDMSASAQAVVDKQGVAYNDRDGDLVTSIVNGKDCVFTCYDFGLGFIGFARVTLRGARKGERIFIGDMEYICSGQLDEQACLRFTTMPVRKLTIYGDNKFRADHIVNVEGISIISH